MKDIRLRSQLSIFAVLILTVGLSAEERGPKERIVPEIRALRINPHAPAIDGKVDDAIWGNPSIGMARSFTQREPDEGRAVTESTLVEVAYDDEALYVAFQCYDSDPGKIDGLLVRRDRSSLSDRVTLRVDPFHDHQSGYAFEVNAAGVQRDCRYYDDVNTDMSWDAVWESDVSQQPWGWSAELRIPYHCLRFSEQPEQTWGIDFQRVVNRKNEISLWAFVPSSEGGFVRNFGHLTSLAGIQSTRHLEVLPYVVANAQTEPKHPGNPDGKDFVNNVGFDVKYGVSSDLVLNATINPDFGQVELDAPVLNLSTYETFFPERRPFFVEGSDLFETAFDLFYSRRIGRPPRGSARDPEFLYYSEFPKSTTILGAAKMTGKVSKRTSIALLTAITQREEGHYVAGTNVVLDSTGANVVSMDTVSRKAVVEPEAGYTVLRLKHEVLKNSHVGGMLTLASQDGVSPATTGGFDWRLATNNAAWQTYGQVIFSEVDKRNTGYGIDAIFERAGGKHVLGAMEFTIKDPALNINRLGYASRVNVRNVWAWLQYRTTDDWWIVRNSYNNFNFWSSWNFDGISYSLGGDFNTYIEFTNFWSLGGGVSVQGEKYSDLETRGNGLWQWPVYPTFSWWASLNTDQRKKLFFNINPGSGGDRGGSWFANYVGAGLRPSSNAEFSLGVNYKRTFRGTRWVANIDTSSLFADLDYDEIHLSGSASVLINRNLSIQLSGEGLIDGLDYSRHRYYQGGNRYSDPVSGFNTDYNYSALNSTFLIRWEYHPGSTLYLVWTRSRDEFDPKVNNVDFSRDLKRLFSSGSSNLFLIKASHWLSI